MGPTFTVTVPLLGCAAYAAAVLAWVAAAYVCGLLNGRDERTLAGPRETNARFEQPRALASRSRARLVETLTALRALTSDAEPAPKPRWATATVVLEEPPPLAPDEQREVEYPDGDSYPQRLRAKLGAMRLPVEAPAGDWPVNPPTPGRHRFDRLAQETQPMSRALLERVLADGAP
jgi:hypothetical protein